jgi:hypothetical protein
MEAPDIESCLKLYPPQYLNARAAVLGRLGGICQPQHCHWHCFAAVLLISPSYYWLLAGLVAGGVVSIIGRRIRFRKFTNGY